MTQIKRFEHEGIHCVICRSPATTALCGYVLVSEGHPWHGVDYEDVDVEVHGGLTYAGGRPTVGVDEGWWVGFDCGHAGDAFSVPGSSYRMPGVVRDAAYVEAECRNLADQLLAVEGWAPPLSEPSTGDVDAEVDLEQLEKTGRALEEIR